jgi:tRNA-splicing ligase RtcB
VDWVNQESHAFSVAEAWERQNHKVVAVTPLLESEDVYCLSVPEYGNFALNAGVFVHNCGMAAIKMPFKGDRLFQKLVHLLIKPKINLPLTT